MAYLGDIRLGDTIDFHFTTRQISGAPSTLSSSPVLSCYVGNSSTEITAGITLDVDFDSRTGMNHVRIVASGGNGYATASNYSVVITTGTVNSVSVVGEVIGNFSIEARSALMPATAARTLLVDATGNADARLADAVSHGGTLGSSTATLALSRLNVTSQTSNTSAVTILGNGTGHGLISTSGSGVTGNGIVATSAATNGSGFSLTGTGTGSGLLANTATISGAVALGSTLTVSGLTTLTGLTTGAISASTITASGAVAFQSTFAVTTSTALGAISGSTLTLSGTTSLAAVTTSGTVTLNALTVSNTTTLTGAVSLGSTLGVTGTTTLNALTVTNAFTVSGATTLTGAVAAINAGNDIRGVALTSAYDAAKTAGDATAANQVTINNNVLTRAIPGDAMALTAAYDAAKTAITTGGALTEGYRANGATGTLPQLMYELISHLGESGISGTTKTINKLDHTTAAATFTLDDATSPTAITRAT